jgi:hypothetical protein
LRAREGSEREREEGRLRCKESKSLVHAESHARKTQLSWVVMILGFSTLGMGSSDGSTTRRTREPGPRTVFQGTRPENTLPKN